MKRWVAAAAAAVIAATSTAALAQDKRVRMQIAGAFPS